MSAANLCEAYSDRSVLQKNLCENKSKNVKELNR